MAATTSTPVKVLISGVTGLIGGSILHTFLTTNDSALKNLKFTALIRNEAQASKLQALGVETLLFKDLDSSAELTQAASEHDIVIHNANGFHPESAKALIRGLAARKASTGREVYYLHTSGTSNLADLPITGKYVETHGVFSDTKDDVYEYMKKREAGQQWPQRTTDLAIVETGKEVGVKTYIVMSGTIFGRGTGAFNTSSIQIPLLMKLALSQNPKQVFVLGEGKGRWDRVHIEDVSRIYPLLVSKLLGPTGASVPSGEKGIFFTSGDHFSWASLSAAVGKAGKELGFLDTSEPKSISVEEAGKMLPNELFAELALGSNALTSADYAKEVLGWKPEKSGEESLVQSLVDDWTSVGKAVGN